jgi:5-methyltetrahydropteroyltriglutamate--homocysteine methyltransferase
MTAATTPTIFRAENVGSTLRPAWLLEARGKWMAGDMGPLEFKRLEDRAVDESLRVQEEAGLDVVCDGEMRRMLFTGTLTEAISGLAPITTYRAEWGGGSDDAHVEVPFTVVEKIARRRSLATEEFTYLRSRTDRPIKVTLPSPLVMGLFWSAEHSRDAYPDAFELFEDAVAILRLEIEELIELGCQNIQIDAPDICLYGVDDAVRADHAKRLRVDPDRLVSEGTELINAVASGFEDVTFGLHLCRGNNAGRFLGSGGYEAITKSVLERTDAFEVYLLEFDDERSGGFDALADLPQDKVVVLGLVSTKRAELERREDLIERLESAARHYPREQLALSSQCGFASVAIGNPQMNEQLQRQKLRLVAEVAHEFWS